MTWQRLTYEQRGPDECWPWPKPIKGRYPQVTRGGRRYRANRLALEEKLGRPIRPGYVARHTCDNPVCGNPAHLLEGTPADNSRDMVERGRSQRGECNPHSKLTDEQRRAIRADERSLKVIAEEYGVTKQAVAWVKKRWVR